MCRDVVLRRLHISYGVSTFLTASLQFLRRRRSMLVDVLYQYTFISAYHAIIITKKWKFAITIYSDFFAFFTMKIYLCYKFYTHLIQMC